MSSHCKWVCVNSQQALESQVHRVPTDPNRLSLNEA